MSVLIVLFVCLAAIGGASLQASAAESRLKTRVLLEFGRLIPPHLEGPAVSLAAEFYALGFRSESAGPYGVEVLADQYFDVKRKLRADIYLPAEAKPPLPAVMLIHGGGWKYFSKAAVAGYGRLLASHGLAAVAVDYRLSAEARWPAQLEDLHRALAWLQRHAEDWGIDPKRIAALGDSAGGHLAAMLGTVECETTTRLAAVVAYYGVYDMVPLISHGQEAIDNPINQLLPDDSESTCREASPINHIDANTPPFLLIHGLSDSVVPVEQTEVFADRLIAAGVPSDTLYVEGADHMLLGLRLPIKPSLREVDSGVIAFLHRCLAVH
ncbi:MAG: alpha/beta hydrolase fold domain-containing protein [Limnochordia bacterium]|jgi:acetyl esterase/lipase